MFNRRPKMLAADCAKAWCSNNNVPFACFVSPWFGALELLLDYNTVELHNQNKENEEWFCFFRYSNGSAATHWGFDLFININDSSKYKGAVIVRVTTGKLAVFHDRVYYVFEGIQRKLQYAKYSEMPRSQRHSGSIDINQIYNYYIADDITYRKSDKSEGQLLDENLRGLIDQAMATTEARGRMHGYPFHVPVINGLLADLVDGLVSSEDDRRRFFFKKY